MDLFREAHGQLRGFPGVNGLRLAENPESDLRGETLRRLRIISPQSTGCYLSCWLNSGGRTLGNKMVHSILRTPKAGKHISRHALSGTAYLNVPKSSCLQHFLRLYLAREILWSKTFRSPGVFHHFCERCPWRLVADEN